MKRKCKCCGKVKEIANNFYLMCFTCNSDRLREDKPNKVKEPINKKTGSENVQKLIFPSLGETMYYKATQRIEVKKLKSDSDKIMKLTFGDQTTLTGKPKNKLSFQVNPTHKAPNKIKLDELFYERCFNLSNHLCEECNQPLPDYFRNDNGTVAARWRYSHIIPKSIAPEHRHNPDNINHLCLKHHQQWETGEKKTMKIYIKNLVLWKGFLDPNGSYS